jgi:hypothetical protein
MALTFFIEFGLSPKEATWGKLCDVAQYWVFSSVVLYHYHEYIAAGAWFCILTIVYFVSLSEHDQDP